MIPDSQARVALFIDSDVFAGTERHMAELAGALKEQSLHISMICPAASPLNAFAEKLGVETISIEKRGLFDVSAMLKLRGQLASGRIDLIHSHNGRTALGAAAARRLAGKGFVVATQHFIDPAHAGRAGIEAIVSRAAHRWVQRETDQYIAVSRAAKEAMVARERRLAGKIAVIPNGISAPDPALLIPAPQVRDSLGIPASAPLIVCAARLAAEKDIATLIEAMGPVASHIPDARCVIAGDGPLRGELEARVRNAPWGRQILLAGFRADAMSIINAADLFVLPSRAEPFGLVLLEAMALGKPVVSTAAGGPLEIVKNGETGILVPPGDAVSMAQAIIRLLAQPELRRSMGAGGLSRFQSEFTARAMAAATARVYQRAMRLPSPAVPAIKEEKCESF